MFELLVGLGILLYAITFLMGLGPLIGGVFSKGEMYLAVFSAANVAALLLYIAYILGNEVLS